MDAAASFSLTDDETLNLSISSLQYDQIIDAYAVALVAAAVAVGAAEEGMTTDPLAKVAEGADDDSTLREVGQPSEAFDYVADHTVAGTQMQS